MQKDNIPLLVHRIISGKLYITINGIRYTVHAPNADQKYEAELFYESVIEDNKYDTWFRKENILNILKYVGLWDDDDDIMLTDTEKKIETLKHNLYTNRLLAEKTKNIRQDLTEKKQFLDKLLNRKHSLDYLTLEDYANIRKNEYLIVHNTYGLNNQLIFSDVANIDTKLFFAISTNISESFISIEQYKTMAKHEYWKNIWNSNKNHLFTGPACLYTDEQKTLINISLMYDRIYEHPECPDESVVNDDDMLDGWMIDQKKKNEEKKKENNAKDLVNKHKNAKEIFIVSDPNDANSVYSMNTGQSRSIIKQRAGAIAKAQEGLDEFRLPDVQQDLMLKRNSRG